MLSKWEVGDILVQVVITNGIYKLKWIKILRNFQTKSVKIMQYILQHKSM